MNIESTDLIIVLLLIPVPMFRPRWKLGILSCCGLPIRRVVVISDHECTYNVRDMKLTTVHKR